jgi:Fe-S oxidoreductase
MLTIPERILFSLATFLVVLLAARATHKIIKIIDRGSGKPEWGRLPSRLFRVILKSISLSTVFKHRLVTSILHGLVAWAFLFYLLVNLGDVLDGFISNFHFLGRGLIADLYRLGADVLSVAALGGMVALLIRRFIIRPTSLDVKEETLLIPSARKGVKRDSLIVGIFILLHVGARFTGASFQVAIDGVDKLQPFASSLAGLWSGWDIAALNLGRHVAWWIALGGILAFFPYLPSSKHMHIFMAPLNFLLQPERRSIGELTPLDFDDESVEQFGAERIEDLSWSAIFDAYACIMCNRCQDACPAYETGKVLSPAAMEINKRYFLNQEASRLAAGAQSSQKLTDYAITPEAIWACTACGACVEVCPVGNEPMRDILEIRRHLVLMENRFPEELQIAFRGMERAANPWNVGPEERLKWAEGHNVPTIKENPDPEILWWVGCAPATDPRAQNTAISFANILNKAGVSFAVLGDQERCTGDSARRSGNEYIFNELAKENVEQMNNVSPNRIVTTCPHCLHTLKNEYPAFGGHYEVVHHTQLLEELIQDERINLSGSLKTDRVTLHDPCYLGRQNDIFAAPRNMLKATGAQFQELTRSSSNSFCCGAGGGQMWKEEEQGNERVSMNRLNEAIESGAESLAVACPFCMLMLNDVAVTSGTDIRIQDIVEIVAEGLDNGSE